MICIIQNTINWIHTIFLQILSKMIVFWLGFGKIELSFWVLAKYDRYPQLDFNILKVYIIHHLKCIMSFKGYLMHAILFS